MAFKNLHIINPNKREAGIFKAFIDDKNSLVFNNEEVLENCL